MSDEMRRREQDVISAVLSWRKSNPVEWDTYASLRLMNAVEMYENAARNKKRQRTRRAPWPLN